LHSDKKTKIKNKTKKTNKKQQQTTTTKQNE